VRTGLCGHNLSMTRASIATAAVAFALTAPAGAANVSKPSLTLLRLAPPKLHGTHFKAGEQVGIRFKAGKTEILRSVRVSMNGEFTVVLGSVTLTDRCGSEASLVAAGTLGDRSVVKLPQTGCPATVTPTRPATTTTGNYVAPPPPYTT
jgi:hypothetical protein